MRVHVLTNEQALGFVSHMAGATRAGDLRTAIVRAENSIRKAIAYHHSDARGMLGGTWWQNTMAESLQDAERDMIEAEAELRDLGEPRTTVTEDRARERAGFFPYTGRMADYMAQHLGGQS